MSKSNRAAVPNNANDNAAYAVGYGKPPKHVAVCEGKVRQPLGSSQGIEK